MAEAAFIVKAESNPGSTRPRIGVVGPCKSGKSTLVHGLQEAGYQANQIAQEHSFAPSMWQQVTPPDLLIYLHCEYETTTRRGLAWTRKEYAEQAPRLQHARLHADLELTTDVLPPEVILSHVLEFLAKRTS